MRMLHSCHIIDVNDVNDVIYMFFSLLYPCGYVFCMVKFCEMRSSSDDVDHLFEYLQLLKLSAPALSVPDERVMGQRHVFGTPNK